MRSISLLAIILVIGIASVSAGSASDSVISGPSNATVAPAFFRVKFHTTIGDIILNITRTNAPLGVDRFYDLVQAGYFGTSTDNACGFFRVLPGFVVQVYPCCHLPCTCTLTDHHHYHIYVVSIVRNLRRSSSKCRMEYCH
jgi:hypothetical protein